jgi:hypothetical protein
MNNELEPGEFQFGFLDRQAYFFNTYKPLLLSLPELQEAFDLVIANVGGQLDNLSKRLIFYLGRMGWEDFNEIILMCANGFHSGGHKVLRPMFEHVIYSGHFRLHPEDAERFWDFYLVDRYKLMKQIKDKYPNAFPDEKLQEAKAAYDSLGDKFKVPVCEECRPIICAQCNTENECQRCKKTRDNFTWTRKDIVSMAREQEFDIILITAMYYFAMQETHPKVISITNRLESAEDGAIGFTDEPNWGKIREIIVSAHYLILRVLENYANTLNIKGLEERLEQVVNRHKEIWEQIRASVSGQAAT